MNKTYYTYSISNISQCNCKGTIIYARDVVCTPLAFKIKAAPNNNQY